MLALPSTDQLDGSLLIAEAHLRKRRRRRRNLAWVVAVAVLATAGWVWHDSRSTSLASHSNLPSGNGGVISAAPQMASGAYIAVDGEPPRLCGLTLDSRPPGCGAPSVVLAGVVISQIPGLHRQSGVSFTDNSITVYGALSNGVFHVTRITSLTASAFDRPNPAIPLPSNRGRYSTAELLRVQRLVAKIPGVGFCDIDMAHNRVTADVLVLDQATLNRFAAFPADEISLSGFVHPNG